MSVLSSIPALRTNVVPGIFVFVTRIFLFDPQTICSKRESFAYFAFVPIRGCTYDILAPIATKQSIG